MWPDEIRDPSRPEIQGQAVAGALPAVHEVQSGAVVRGERNLFEIGDQGDLVARARAVASAEPTVISSKPSEHLSARAPFHEIGDRVSIADRLVHVPVAARARTIMNANQPLRGRQPLSTNSDATVFLHPAHAARPKATVIAVF